jgi:hypothetical protein
MSTTRLRTVRPPTASVPDIKTNEKGVVEINMMPVRVEQVWPPKPETTTEPAIAPIEV